MRSPRHHIPTDFSHLRNPACAGCGKTAKETKLTRLPGVTTAFGCPACILKFGTDVLSGEIDRLFDLAVGMKAESKPCGRGCGRHVTRDYTGRFPLWCEYCEKERREILAS